MQHIIIKPINVNVLSKDLTIMEDKNVSIVSNLNSSTTNKRIDVNNVLKVWSIISSQENVKNVPQKNHYKIMENVLLVLMEPIMTKTQISVSNVVLEQIMMKNLKPVFYHLLNNQPQHVSIRKYIIKTLKDVYVQQIFPMIQGIDVYNASFQAIGVKVKNNVYIVLTKLFTISSNRNVNNVQFIDLSKETVFVMLVLRIHSIAQLKRFV